MRCVAANISIQVLAFSPVQSPLTMTTISDPAASSIEADFWRELAEIEVESIGWLPLSPGAYLHVGDDNATEVTVVGIPQCGAAVLLMG